MLRAFARAVFYPGTLTAAVAGAWLALQAGWATGLVFVAASVFTLGACALAERWLPFDPDWNRARGDVGTDLLHSIVSSYAGRELYKLLFVALLLPALGGLQRGFSLALWPVGWPLLAQLALALLAAELGQYWAHRLAHERPLLWRVHAAHHSAERLYWLNAGREHPLTVLLFTLGTGLPLALLGCPAECLALFYVFESAHGLLQHANVDVRTGPLNWLLSSADLHRWHHSRASAQADHNYGANLILWDLAFGTRLLPDAPRAPAALGIAEPRGFPRGWWAQILAPFRWEALDGARAWRLRRGAGSGSGSRRPLRPGAAAEAE